MTEAALHTLERLRELTGFDLEPFLTSALEGNPAPDLALTNLERWLRVTASPGMYAEQIAGLPKLGRLLMTLFGASQPVADSLIQNPELSALILEPGQLRHEPTQEGIVEEGRRLLAASTSYSHALDRLRFLRQRWNLVITINDLAGTWEQEAVWRALSSLAGGLIQLAWEVAYEDQRRQRELPEACPVLVVGFGKLGGDELNYSSDVDLVYATEDGLDERLERNLTRFCEALGRAIGDRMGRGTLYRVDLRLRPYGGAGPILRSMRSIEAYYNLYAEPWEVQALLRSQAICGPEDLVARWEAMRERTCFRPKLTEIALEAMVAMRARIEEGASADDLKRGPGGIRDAEFLTQILQLVHGHDQPRLRVRPTCDALRALDELGVMEHPVAAALIEGYTFLRKLEHRTQLVGDQQTHTIPSGLEAREALARSMDLPDWRTLSSELDRHRRTIQTLYRRSLHLDANAGGARDQVGERLGSAALQWFDVLPEGPAFYAGLVENADSLARVERILTDAPRLVGALKESVALTEMLLSGEIEEPADPVARIDRLPLDAAPRTVAEAHRNAETAALAAWTLAPDDHLGERLAAIREAALRHCLRRLHADFDVVATGSFGMQECAPASDADLILLIDRKERHPQAEAQAQEMLALVGALKRLGAPLQVDLRLRPEGGKGLLVRTYDGFRAYDFDGMEMWERFALGHARQIAGNPEGLNVVLHSAYGLPLTPERLRELVKMKRRVETERVRPQHVHRDVKLGYGGLSDIEWLVHLHEMRYPSATKAGTSVRMPERIANLARAGLLNAIEAELVAEARRYLLELRLRIYLQGHEDDLLPENPDRLDRLAHGMGEAGANELLARHRDTTEAVRRLYLEGLERLKA